LGRSLRFYAELLGLAVLDRTPDSAALAFGDGRILLRQTAHTPPPDDSRVIHVHVQVSDIDAAYQSLRAKGVGFVAPPSLTSHGDRLALWSATFRDPDGHHIALTQWRATPGATETTDPGTGPSAQDAAPHVQNVDPH
ncbi:MAG: VOC family protein, partial [Sporichthyaceae bacterium]|nr:VOC family protein [Sporichthyaceae bacterium]